MRNVMAFRTIGLGLGSLSLVLVAVSCGGAQGGSDDENNTGGTAGASGSPTGGTGGTPMGGTAGMPGGGTGGSATGGASGSATGGTAGMEDCTPNPPPQTCSGSTPNMHDPPDGLLINWETYNVGTGSWGNSAVGDLTGGTSKYNGRDVAQPTVELVGGDLHITATVPPYTPDVADDAENFSGLVFWFGPCINASAFGGVSFTVSGTLPGAALKLQVQTSENYPADPANTKGSCIFDNCDERWSQCKGPDATVIVPAAGEPPVEMTWDAFTAGSPNAGVNATGLVGLQFQFECQSMDTECVIDLTLGDISLTPL
jgi:hypothetical protein